MQNTRKLLGGRIKELRKLRGLSQEKLSEKIGIDPKHLSRIEVGGSYPSLDTLEKIAGILKVDIKDIFELSHKTSNPEDVRNAVINLLKEADEERLRLVAKVVTALVR